MRVLAQFWLVVCVSSRHAQLAFVTSCCVQYMSVTLPCFRFLPMRRRSTTVSRRALTDVKAANSVRHCVMLFICTGTYDYYCASHMGSWTVIVTCMYCCIGHVCTCTTSTCTCMAYIVLIAGQSDVMLTCCSSCTCICVMMPSYYISTRTGGCFF